MTEGANEGLYLSQSMEKLEEGNETFDGGFIGNKVKGYIPDEDLDSEMKKIEKSYMSNL